MPEPCRTDARGRYVLRNRLAGFGAALLDIEIGSDMHHISINGDRETFYTKTDAAVRVLTARFRPGNPEQSVTNRGGRDGQTRKTFGALADRSLHTGEVIGSIPIAPTTLIIGIPLKLY